MSGIPPELAQALNRMIGRRKCFKLVDRQVVETTLADWMVWFETADRYVAETEIGRWRVSTVFIGTRPTELFETMVFDGLDTGVSGMTRRYNTWDEAEAGHAEVVASVRDRLREATRVVD